MRDLEVAAICYKAVIASNIKFENIEFKKLGMYIAMNLTAQEAMILSREFFQPEHQRQEENHG